MNIFETLGGLDFLFMLQNIRNPFFDVFFSICTMFAEELVLIGIFATTYWCINKHLGYKIAFTYFISGIAVQGLKLKFRINRPWDRGVEFTPVSSALETATGYSFPSGHTQCSTSLYGSMAFHIRRKSIYVLCFIVIGLVMLSRMYLGCHTPLDVLTGFIITIIISVVVEFVSENVNMPKAFDISIVIVLELACIALIYYFYNLVTNNVTTDVLAMDGFKACGACMGFGISWYIEKHLINFDTKTYSVKFQFVKLFVGLTVALILKVGLKAILGDNMLGNTVRYFVIVLWIACVFPFFIKKFINEKNL